MKWIDPSGEDPDEYGNYWSDTITVTANRYNKRSGFNKVRYRPQQEFPSSGDVEPLVRDWDELFREAFPLLIGYNRDNFEMTVYNPFEDSENLIAKTIEGAIYGDYGGVTHYIPDLNNFVIDKHYSTQYSADFNTVTRTEESYVRIEYNHNANYYTNSYMQNDYYEYYSYSETTTSIDYYRNQTYLMPTQGIPDWIDKTNTGIGAFNLSNGVKTELIELAGRTTPLGHPTAQYLRYAKGLGYLGAGVSSVYYIANAGVYYKNGGTDWQVGIKAGLYVIMIGVGCVGPIGFGISSVYFIIDAAGGFGDFGKVKP